ncbi:hypothetical protein Q7P37_006284 [Cladosporium fusiforme]
MEPTAVIDSIYEPNTGTWQYVVADPLTLRSVIIDPVLDFDAETQTVSTNAADHILSLVRERGYKVDRILETHVHADHLTAASYLRETFAHEQGFRPSVAIGKRIRQVQQFFGGKYDIPIDELSDAFDKLFDDDETFEIGSLRATAIHLPGHTPDHMGYKIGGKTNPAYISQNIPDSLPRKRGSAKALYHSVQKLLSLPDHYNIYTGHDYISDERKQAVPYMTVLDHKERNHYAQADVSEQIFMEMRETRDADLSEPKLLHAALQTNIRGGRLPKTW